MYAHFELRQMELQMARKVLGTAIGKCPKKKLFNGYLDMELNLREFDRHYIFLLQFSDYLISLKGA